MAVSAVDAGRQLHQIPDGAVFCIDRDVGEDLARLHIREVSLLGLNQLRSAFDRHRLSGTSDLQSDVDAAICGSRQLDIVGHKPLESGLFRRDAVDAGNQVGRDVVPHFVASDPLTDVRADVGDDHFDARHDAAGQIQYRTSDSAIVNLCLRHSREQK